MIALAALPAPGAEVCRIRVMVPRCQDIGGTGSGTRLDKKRCMSIHSSSMYLNHIHIPASNPVYCGSSGTACSCHLMFTSRADGEGRYHSSERILHAELPRETGGNTQKDHSIREVVTARSRLVEGRTRNEGTGLRSWA